MKSKLFLQGNPGLGKSSLLQRFLIPVLPQVGGFFVQRIFIMNRYAAFKLNAVAKAEEYQLNRHVTSLDGEDNLFLYSDDRGKWHHNTAVFERSGIPILQRSMDEKKELVLMDELGGIELNCLPFMKVVLELFDREFSVLGVLKTPQNKEKLKANLADKTYMDENTLCLFNRIRHHPQMEVLNVSDINNKDVHTIVKTFVEGCLQ